MSVISFINDILMLFKYSTNDLKLNAVIDLIYVIFSTENGNYFTDLCSSTLLKSQIVAIAFLPLSLSSDLGGVTIVFEYHSK